MMLESEVYKPGTCLYFAYSVNMLEFRMHMHTPSAEFVSIGRADNYRLHFIKFHKFWQGPQATMVPTANAHVWGVIYRIDSGTLVSLDDAKGVNYDIYYSKYITIRTPYIGEHKCRCYIQKVNPLPRGDNDPIPCEYWPSMTCKTLMLMGAREHGLPPYYIQQLESIKDNGEEGMLRVYCLCVRYGTEEPCECAVPGRIPRKPLKLDLQEKRQNGPQYAPPQGGNAPQSPEQSIDSPQEASSKADYELLPVGSNLQSVLSQEGNNPQNVSSQAENSPQKVPSQEEHSPQEVLSQAENSPQKVLSQAENSPQKVLSQAENSPQNVPSQVMENTDESTEATDQPPSL